MIKNLFNLLRGKKNIETVENLTCPTVPGAPSLHLKGNRPTGIMPKKEKEEILIIEEELDWEINNPDEDGETH